MNEIITWINSVQFGWTEWSLGLLSALLLGWAKAGIKGLGPIIVTFMALAFGGKNSTGIVLPLLMLGDVFAIAYYTKYTQWKYLFRFLPWMLVGIVFGAFIGKDLPEDLFKRGMAVIILASVIMMVWWERRRSKEVPNQWWFASIMGLGAGFTTMVGNLAGAFSNIFFLAMQLPKNQFIGTVAWLYFISNIFKLPFHVFMWETVNAESLSINLRLLPGLFLGLLSGIFLVKLISNQRYRQFILVMTAIGAVLIFFR